MRKENEPVCPLQRQGCGGCQHLEEPYPRQLARKQALVEKLLGPLGPVEPILGMEDPWHYRCKVTASFAEGRQGLACGLYARHSRRVLPAGHCPLQDQQAEALVQAVLQAARECRYTVYDPAKGTGLLRHVQVRQGLFTGQQMATLVTGPEQLPGSRRFTARVRQLCPGLTTLVQSVNPRDTSLVLGERCRTLFGPGAIEDALCGLRFRISPLGHPGSRPHRPGDGAGRLLRHRHHRAGGRGPGGPGAGGGAEPGGGAGRPGQRPAQ